MDFGTTFLLVAIGLTVLGLLLVASLWRVTSWKSRLTLLGLTAMPLGLYFGELGPQLLGAYQTLDAWWRGLTFTIGQLVGLSLLTAAAVFLILGRLIPHRPRKKKDVPPASAASQRPSVAPASPAKPADTATLPRSTDQTWSS